MPRCLRDKFRNIWIPIQSRGDDREIGAAKPHSVSSTASTTRTKRRPVLVRQSSQLIIAITDAPVSRHFDSVFA